MTKHVVVEVEGFEDKQQTKTFTVTDLDFEFDSSLRKRLDVSGSFEAVIFHGVIVDVHDPEQIMFAGPSGWGFKMRRMGRELYHTPEEVVAAMVAKAQYPEAINDEAITRVQQELSAKQQPGDVFLCQSDRNHMQVIILSQELYELTKIEG